jgi:hypothetical protein
VRTDVPRETGQNFVEPDAVFWKLLVENHFKVSRSRPGGDWARIQVCGKVCNDTRNRTPKVFVLLGQILDGGWFFWAHDC